MLVALHAPVVAVVTFGATILLSNEDALLARGKVADAIEAVRPEDGVAGCRRAGPRGEGVGDAEFAHAAEAGNNLVFKDELVPLRMLPCAEVQGCGDARAHEVVLPLVVIRGSGRALGIVR